MSLKQLVVLGVLVPVVLFVSTVLVGFLGSAPKDINSGHANHVVQPNRPDAAAMIPTT